MEFISYKKDENKVTLTGTITSMPDFCRFMTIGDETRPILSFDLISYRRSLNGAPPKTDENKIVVLDDDSFFEKYKVGDRIRLTGELQSRNYTRDNHEIDESISLAVSNYIEIFGEYPTDVHPVNSQRYPVNWSKIHESGLLPFVPHDSMFLMDGTKDKSAERPYVYRVDAYGELFKETEHVTYEILARNITLLEEPLDPAVGDKNIIVLFGKISRDPNFDIIGDNPKSFCNFSIKTDSKTFPNRIFYNNVVTWGGLADDVFSEFVKDDLVKVIGRLQSRRFNKEFTRRWTTPGGNRKKQTKEFEVLTHEISASTIQKGYIKKKKKNSANKKTNNPPINKNNDSTQK